MEPEEDAELLYGTDSGEDPLQQFSHAFDTTQGNDLTNPASLPTPYISPSIFLPPEPQAQGVAAFGPVSSSQDVDVSMQTNLPIPPPPTVPSTISAAAIDRPAATLVRPSTSTRSADRMNRRVLEAVPDDNNRESKRYKIDPFSKLEGVLSELFRMTQDPHPQVKESFARGFSKLIGTDFKATCDYLEDWFWTQRERLRNRDEGYITGAAQPDPCSSAAPQSIPFPIAPQVFQSTPQPTLQRVPQLEPQPVPQTVLQPVPEPVAQPNLVPPPPTHTPIAGRPPSATITCPKCSRSSLNHSAWESHKDSHWRVKYGCMYCYIHTTRNQRFSCKLCPVVQGRGKRLFDTLDQAVTHVVGCIRGNEREMGKIMGRGNKKRWWKEKRNGHQMLLSHLADDPEHSQLPLALRDENYTRSWTTEVQQTEKTCLDCPLAFPTVDDLNRHYDTDHFGTGSWPHGTDMPPGPPGEDDAGEDGDNNGYTGPSIDSQQRPPQTVNPRFGGNGEGDGTAGYTQNPVNQQYRATRPESPLSFASDETLVCELSMGSRSTSSDETIVVPPDDCSSYSPFPKARAEQILWGMGSQFTHDIEPLSNRGKGLEGTMLNYLGKGATGEVRAVWLSGSPLARKTIRFSLDVAHWDAVIAQIRREIKTLGLLHHRHIVRLVECHETLDNSMELLMAPAAEYNLMTVLTDKSNESMLPAGNRDTKLVDQVAGWMACLSSALAYMHSAGVTHGDIKPQNILVSGTQVWLADFGTGEFEAEPCGNLHSESRWATPVYRPREALQSSSRLRQRGMSADMWSFGCVLLEVATWLAGGSVQALRNFTGVEARRQPYHLAFDRIQTWIEVLRRRFESQEHLRDRQYLVEAVLGTLVLEPGSRLRGPEVWALLTRGMCHEKDGCPCSCVRRPVPAFGDRRQKALEPCPSGVTAIKEESHGAVLYTEDIQLTTPLAT